MNVGKIVCELQVQNFREKKICLAFCGIGREAVSLIGASSASSQYTNICIPEHLP